MIRIVNGDLLTSDCSVIMHQANCLCAMDAGIAKNIREIYPETYEADKNDTRPPNQKLGSFSYAIIQKTNLIIGNIYGQLKYFGPARLTNYEALENGLLSFLSELHAIKMEHKINCKDKVGVPYGIGCGLARGKWEIVSHILESISSQVEKDIWIYRLPEHRR